MCRGLRKVREQKEGVSLFVLHMLQNKEASHQTALLR